MLHNVWPNRFYGELSLFVSVITIFMDEVLLYSINYQNNDDNIPTQLFYYKKCYFYKSATCFDWNGTSSDLKIYIRKGLFITVIIL